MQRFLNHIKSHLKNATSERGYMAIFFILALGLVVIILLRPKISPDQKYSNDQKYFCRPYVNADGTIKSDAPEIMAPKYEFDAESPKPIIKNEMAPYRLIKSSLPFGNGPVENYFSKNDIHEGSSSTEIHCSNGVLGSQGSAKHYHYCQWVHPALRVSPNLSKADQYALLFPANYTDGQPLHNGVSTDYAAEDGQRHTLRYNEYHIVFLVQLDEQLNYYGSKTDPERFAAPLIDVYQEVKPEDHSKPVVTLPDHVLKCMDEQNSHSSGLTPVIANSPNHEQLQLGWFFLKAEQVANGWYYPSCKPAIYLYPPKPLLANVKVTPKGMLTYTDPKYNQTFGWTVLANPDGSLINKSLNATDQSPLNYLYYESKINDQYLNIPKKGWVLESSQQNKEWFNPLEEKFNDILPKLGLNKTQTKDFIDYWKKALPYSPYYFIGIVDEDNVNQIEKLEITPKPDSINRVRIYFELLDKPKTVEQPDLDSFKRNETSPLNFNVVEWGGLVKRDKNHPFTCSM